MKFRIPFLASVGSVSMALVLLAFTPQAQATPWVEADDPFLRASIEQLAAAGYLKGHRTTYPLMWSGISRDLSNIDVAELSEEHLFAFYRVRAALEFSQRPVTRLLHVKLDSEGEVEDTHNSFGNVSHERAALTSGNTFVGDHWSGRFQTTVRSGAHDGKSYHFVGSYLATTVGNWALSVDQLPVWWGPTHDNALVLSTNSLPFQAVRMTRLSDDPVPWLGWLGHVHMTGFVGRTQSSASLGDNFAGGGRVTVRPHRSVEVGVNYLAHWESLSEFYNQLASVDTRVVVGRRFSIYGEAAANQRDFGKLAYTIGVDTQLSAGSDRLWQAYVEYTSVPEEFYSKAAFTGDTYERDGYRRWDYAIGAGQDQDVSAATFGLITQYAEGNSWSVKFMRAEYGSMNWPMLLTYGSGMQKLERSQVSIAHGRPIKDSLLTLEIRYRYDDVTYAQTPFERASNGSGELGARASWEFRF